MATRPAIFKWRQTEPVLILSAVRWYLRYSLSLRDVEELLKERGLEVDHTTVWHWVQRYGPELEERLRRHLKPTNKSWRVDETYVRVKGRWCYLYRAIDSAGATIDFLLSAFRDADAAKRLFRKALSHPSHPQPRVINTDLAPIYGSAIPDIKKDGILRRRCRHRPVQYLNNILEQDHRAIKRRVNAKQGFREFQAAQRTIQGYEAMNMLRKGQVRWVSGTDVRRQVQFINKLFELAALSPRSLTVSPPNCCEPIERQSKVATLPMRLSWAAKRRGEAKATAKPKSNRRTWARSVLISPDVHNESGRRILADLPKRLQQGFPRTPDTSKPRITITALSENIKTDGSQISAGPHIDCRPARRGLRAPEPDGGPSKVQLRIEEPVRNQNYMTPAFSKHTGFFR